MSIFDGDVEKKGEKMDNINSINKESKHSIFEEFIQLQEKNNKKTMWKSNAVLMFNIVLTLAAILINFRIANDMSEFFLMTTIIFVAIVTHSYVFVKCHMMEMARNHYLKTFRYLQGKVLKEGMDIDTAMNKLRIDYEKKQTTVTKELLRDKYSTTRDGKKFFEVCKKIEGEFFDIIDKYSNEEQTQTEK